MATACCRLIKNSSSASDGFDYDPRDPVMSLMHQNSQSIPMDQAPNDHRQDVLVYENRTHDPKTST